MIKNFTDKDVTSQTGRTFLVTGANTGLGFEITKVLAANGGRVLLGCRSKDRAEAAMAAIKTEIPDAELSFIPLDLANFESIKNAAALVNAEPRLDVLINNAGVIITSRELTGEGFESHFGINHLGTFAFTSLLLPKLEETKKSRVVITSSLTHKLVRIDFDDIHADTGYNAWNRYSMSKLANILHVTELDRRLRARNSNIEATCSHPGLAITEIARNLPKFAQKFIPIAELFFNTSSKGAWPTLAAAVGEGAVGGGYYGPSGFRGWSGPAADAVRAERSKDEALAKKLWNMSIEMTGVDPGI